MHSPVLLGVGPSRKMPESVLQRSIKHAPQEVWSARDEWEAVRRGWQEKLKSLELSRAWREVTTALI